MSLVGFLVTIYCVRASLASSSYQLFISQSNVAPLNTVIKDSLSQTGRGSSPDCAHPSDCREIQRCGHTQGGVYRVFLFGVGKGFLVYCDMVTDGGGWLVFQRRRDGSVDFYRKWQDYKDGFGNLYGEFWLGLDKIHLLTSQYQTELLVEIGDFEGTTKSVTYRRFFVSGEATNYTLSVGQFSGNIGDSMLYHNGMPFSTKDRDNDPAASSNCAVRNHGAWWYNECQYSNLNGEYVKRYGSPGSTYSVTCWYHWKKEYTPLQFTEMKLRPLINV